MQGGDSGREYVSNLGKAGSEDWNKWFSGPLERQADILVHLHYPQRVRMCVCVCLYVCMYLCVFVYACVFIYVCACV